MSRHIFGIHLDGAPTPSVHQSFQTSICGPETLLAALETSLGLSPTENSPLQRARTYRNVIEICLTEDLFYAKSFQCDPLATAQLLLTWRDQLNEAGWHGNIDHEDAPPRLQAFAKIESAFRDTGLADATHSGRITAILAAIEAGSNPGIESLIVTDPSDSIPPCWNKLFGALAAEYNELVPTTILADASTTLGSVQATLLNQKTDFPDAFGSLQVITAFTAEAAADALASQLARLHPASTTLIADPSDRDTLNRHLESIDLPLPTARTETAAALLELPALLLRCRLAPLDPQAWIEFLLHPISPVPSRLRHRLAETINNLPGLGDHWQKTLEECIVLIDAADTDAITKLRQSFADWIDAPLISPDSLTGPALADVLTALVKWLASRASAKKSDDASDASEWIIASRAVAQLESLLRSEATLTQIDVNRLLTDWYQAASATTRFPGQVGSVTAIASPAQLLARQDQIIWWRPAPTRTRRSPWTRAESDWLSSRGVILLDETKLALTAENSASRAVRFAGKSLTIYQVTQSEGRPAEQAGILTRLLSLCGHSIIVPARGFTTTELIPLRSLPPLRRWWNLDTPDLFPPREEESFSSISKLIDAPVEWVLEKHAKLSAGSISSFRASDSALRSGSILHAAAEELFNHPEIKWQAASESSIHQSIAGFFPRLLATQAALYLTPGYEAARTRLLHSAQQSLWRLVEILRESKITEVTLEKKIAAVPFIGGQIGGRIDLIARRDDGQTAVIDLKLGGKTKRREELEKNRHLQLATYGHLMRQSKHTEPATAFFILSNGGTLLTRNESFFPNTNPIPPKGDSPASDWQECWQEFEEIYQWRRKQLDEGRIEVPVPGTEANDPPPIDRWAPPKDGNPYSAFTNLTGHSAIA
jgi:hypothetical protein